MFLMCTCVSGDKIKRAITSDFLVCLDYVFLFWYFFLHIQYSSDCCSGKEEAKVDDFFYEFLVEMSDERNEWNLYCLENRFGLLLFFFLIRL